jgi:hypothetical protein
VLLRLPDERLLALLRRADELLLHVSIPLGDVPDVI